MLLLLLLAIFQSTALLFAQAAEPPSTALPDSPGTVQIQQQGESSLPCRPAASQNSTVVITPPDPAQKPPCPPQADRNPYQRFLNSAAPLPLTPRQKGFLALHNIVDPANLFTITANAGFTVGIDSHTAYGPGWKGFGKDAGYSLVQDATGEIFATFIFDSLFHEDPHYHRSPSAPIPRRVLHAISHTVISEHDDGRPMINYSVLLTYPISAELANLYVPGVASNGPSTVKRIGIGLASNPIDDLITEFLPDFAKRIHIRVVFLQQILNHVSIVQPM